VPRVGLGPAGSLAWPGDRVGLAGPSPKNNKNNKKKIESVEIEILHVLEKNLF
jgi:hypothetical protein